MAKKPRTPTPPRVQAPRQRHDAPDMGDNARKILYALAAAGVLGLAVVVALILLGGGGSSAKAAATTITAAGCRYKHYPELPRQPHYATQTPDPPAKYNSVPPTSGRHYVQPIIFNQYTEPLPEIRLVHNLEHGAVILQYGNKVPQAQVAEITRWYRDDPNAIVVAPLPSLGAKTALTAWTQWTECTGFNEKAANAFRKAFRYKAPEKFPKSYLEPGQ
jgi:hypothetical protein